MEDQISAPKPISKEHDVSQFNCGNVSLNEYLQKKALRNQGNILKTYVACHHRDVIAYYTLAVGSIRRKDIVKRLQRNAPDQIGFVLLARLAVDITWQGKGFGQALLAEAIKKTVEVSSIVGVMGLLVHAIDEATSRFYKSRGFLECPIQNTLILPIKDILYNLP